jgi:tripartite-type tricarboxylate transporter receptor subunit TctC
MSWGTIFADIGASAIVRDDRRRYSPCMDPHGAHRRRFAAGLAAIATGAALPSRAGDAYPSRPVRLIVPFTPAGATDILARQLGEALSKRLGANVVPENRPGAGGNLGAELVARAPADGYTLLMGPITIYAAGATLQPDRGFDLARDFAMVSTVARVPHILVAAAGQNIASLDDVVRLARRQPGSVAIASQGVGTISHLESALFEHMAAVRLLHVPYKGSAPAHLDLFGGRVALMFDSVAATLGHIRAGKLRAIAVTTRARTPLLPDVPTVAEAGLPGYAAESWLGILAPAKTPRAVIDRLTTALRAQLTDARFGDRLKEQGFEAVALTGDEADSLVLRETTRWAEVIRRAGITLR